MQHLADGHNLVGFQHWRMCCIRIRRRLRMRTSRRSSASSSSHVVHPLERLVLVLVLVRILLVVLLLRVLILSPQLRPARTLLRLLRPVHSG